MMYSFRIIDSNFLQRASRLICDPGNLSLARTRVSMTSFLIIFSQQFLIHYLDETNQSLHCE